MRTFVHGVLCTLSPFFLDGGAANLVQIVVQVKHVNQAVAFGNGIGIFLAGSYLVRNGFGVRRSYLLFARDISVLWRVVKALWLFNLLLKEVVLCTRNHICWFVSLW